MSRHTSPAFVARIVPMLALLVTVPLLDGLMPQQVYWVNSDGIMRSEVDGSSRDRIIPNAGQPVAVALDGADGWVYWSLLVWTIRRAELNTIEFEDIVSAGQVIDMDVDESVRRLYWVEVNPPLLAVAIHPVRQCARSVGITPRSTNTNPDESKRLRLFSTLLGAHLSRRMANLCVPLASIF